MQPLSFLHPPIKPHDPTPQPRTLVLEVVELLRDLLPGLAHVQGLRLQHGRVVLLKAVRLGDVPPHAEQPVPGAHLLRVKVPRAPRRVQVQLLLLLLPPALPVDRRGPRVHCESQGAPSSLLYISNLHRSIMTTYAPFLRVLLHRRTGAACAFRGRRRCCRKPPTLLLPRERGACSSSRGRGGCGQEPRQSESSCEAWGVRAQMEQRMGGGVDPSIHARSNASSSRRIRT